MAKRFFALLRYLSLILIGMIVLPFLCTFVGYTGNTGGVVEQLWLDDAIEYLVYLRQDCPDEELCGILDYTIHRYHKIGPFDVAVNQCDWLPLSDHILGLNNPLCPGITLDIDLLHDYGPHEGSMTLVHEALHDYPPYAGHSYVYPMVNKLQTWREAKERVVPPPPYVPVLNRLPVRRTRPLCTQPSK